VIADMTEDDVFAIFESIRLRGVPHTESHHIDFGRVAELAGVRDLPAVAVEGCVREILCIGLGLLRDRSEVEYEPEGRARLLLGRVSVCDYQEIVLVCRFMEKVYSFEEDFNIRTTKCFKYVVLDNMPAWWTCEHSRSLVLGLCHHGACGVDFWVSDKRLSDVQDIFGHLPSAEGRLRAGSTIVSQARGYSKMKDPSQGTYIVSESAHLQIEDFGKVVNNQEFRGTNCPYPIGFTSRRFLARNIPGLQRIWYHCEIQAVGETPVFVVSSVDAPERDFVALTPVGAWISMIAALQGTGRASGIVRRVKLSRDWLFGLTRKSVIDKIQSMGRRAGVWFGSNESTSDESGDTDFKPNR